MKKVKHMDKKYLTSGQSPTPYDDAFRTLLVDCKELVIPVISELFGERFTGSEKVVFRQNEHFLQQQDGASEKIVSDSSFSIIGDTTRSYLFECQSTEDNSMSIRIFEYSTQIALENHSLTTERLVVTIPHSALLLLRSSKDTPDNMFIEIRTPGGTVEYSVPVMKIKNYTIEEIFEKNLFFLIPFFIFNYESEFKKMEERQDGLERLLEDYSRLFYLLDEVSKEGKISAFTRKTIRDMSNKVLENIASKYDAVMKGVKSVMGGRVLEHEAKTIFNEGRTEGEMKKAREFAINLHNKGFDEIFIAETTGEEVATIRKWLAEQQS